MAWVILGGLYNRTLKLLYFIILYLLGGVATVVMFNTQNVATLKYNINHLTEQNSGYV